MIAKYYGKSYSLEYLREHTYQSYFHLYFAEASPDFLFFVQYRNRYHIERYGNSKFYRYTPLRSNIDNSIQLFLLIFLDTT
ncbi:MAG: hypothetical protein RRX93_08260 [Bacteroidales bacterium]